MDLVRVVPSSLQERENQLERLRLFQDEMRVLKDRTLKKIEDKEKKKGLGSSKDEDAIIGGLIVVGGASKKANKKKNKKKRKAGVSEEKQDGFDPSW